MAITTSPGYHLALWLLFFAVVFGWSWYFHLVQLRLAFALPRLTVVTFQRGPARVRVVTVQAGRYTAISQHTRAEGLRLVTMGVLRERTRFTYTTR
jgi:hypothetical protein